MRNILFPKHWIAHRGAKKLAPENTLAAFLKAKMMGAEWIECDVMLTANGTPVIFHDEGLERTTNGHGEISEISDAALASLDAGSWFSPDFKDERVPTLLQLLDFLKQHNMSAIIELKPKAGTEKALVQAVLAALASDPRYANLHLIFSSFSVVALQTLHQLTQDLQIGLLIDEWFTGWEEMADELNCMSVHFNQGLVDRDLIDKVHAKNRYVLAYTVNDLYRAESLIKMGLDAVFTDDVRLLV